MAYNKPAVQVYQELLNAGGAANISPDLPACIIGQANNVISVDLGDDISKVKSLAAELLTIGSGADQDISVNAESAYPGQIIEDSSIEVHYGNAVVLTYDEGTPAAASSGTLTLTSNSSGGTTAAGANLATNTLPFAKALKHINVGDIVKLDGTVTTFVTRVLSDTQITIADTSTNAGSTSIEIFHKFPQLKMESAGWVGATDVLNIGPTSDTTPMGTVSADLYTCFSENEVKSNGVKMEVYIGYKAGRTDLSGAIKIYNDITDITNELGEIHHDDNPLAFGLSLAIANSGGTAVYGIGIDAGLDEDVAYADALSLAEGQLLYWMVPLTTSTSVQASFKAHVNAMSLPSSGNWRTALFNQDIPTDLFVLGRNDGGLDVNGFQENLIEGEASGSAILLSEGDVANTTPSDTVWVYDGSNSATAPEQLVVNSAEGSVITTTTPITASGQVFIYVSRPAEKQEQAQAIADQSKTYSDKRVYNFPGEVRVSVNGNQENAPGYYLMCALAGLGSGLPAQHGITNITIAGITGLNHSNFYFSEDQLNLMAEFGTLLYVQESQETTPYCRHGLSTDMSVLEYRELLKVKNWDYLSYYYKNILAPFIGTWNITPDTLNTIRQTITSASETLLGRRLPKVGPPLLSYDIARLLQDPNNSDAIIADIKIAIVSPNNYTNVYLQI